jgi:predicted amidophosphoribosyltransferase
MRYCKTCGSVFEDDTERCKDCSADTEELGLPAGQEQLFPETELDRVKSLYQYHKNILVAAEAQASKALEKYHNKIKQRDDAVATLVNFHQLVKSQDDLLEKTGDTYD